MAEWTIDFYKTEDNESPVEKWLLSIPETALAKIARNMELYGGNDKWMI